MIARRRRLIGAILTLIIAMLLAFAVFAVFAFLLFAAGFLLFLGDAQKPHVMFGMLLKILSCHAIIAQMCILGKLAVFVEDLLRRAAHFSFGPGAVKNPINDISD